MAPPKDEADDVLDFLNSLPDSKSGTPKPQSSEGDKQENKEDFLEFLDELAAHEKKPVSKGKSSFEPKRRTPKRRLRPWFRLLLLLLLLLILL